MKFGLTFAMGVILALVLQLLPSLPAPSAQAYPAVTSFNFSDPNDPNASLIHHQDPNTNTYYLTVDQGSNTGQFYLQLPPNTYYVSNTFHAGCTWTGLQSTWAPDQSEYTYDLVSSKFATGCPPDPTTLASEATFTLDFYDLEEWQGMTPNQTLLFTYTVKIIAQSNADNWNFGLNLLNEDNGFVPSWPEAILAKRSWQIMPEPTGVIRPGYVFSGWREFELTSTDWIATGTTFVPGEVYKLDHSIFIKPIWILDEPSGSFSIGGESWPLTDQDENYVALDNTTPGTLSYVIGSVGDYEIALYHPYTSITQNQSSSDPAAIFSSTNSVRNLNATSTSLTYDDECLADPTLIRSCNLLTLVVKIYSPSGASESVSRFNIMLRTEGDGEFCAMYSDLEGYDSGSLTSQCSIRQGWVQLPGSGLSSYRNYDGNSFLLDERDFDEPSFYASSFSIPGPDEGGGLNSFYPLFADTEFVTNWQEDVLILPRTIDLFGNRLVPRQCTDADLGRTASREICFDLLGSANSTVRTIVPEDYTYYFELDFEAEGINSQGESEYEISVDLPDVSNASMLLSGYCGFEICHLVDEQSETTPTVFIPESEMCYDACEDTVYNLELGIGSVANTQYTEITLRFIDVPGGVRNSIFDVHFDSNGADSGEMPDGVASPVWIEAPSTRNLYKAGYMAVGWSLNPNGDGEVFRKKLPITEERTFYAKWVPANVIDFYKFESDSQAYASFRVEHGFAYLFYQVFEYQLTDPTTSGRQFVGWSLTATNQSPIILDDYQFSESTRLYAIWTSPQSVPQTPVSSSPGSGNSGGTPVNAPIVEIAPEITPITPIAEVEPTPTPAPTSKKTSLGINRKGGYTYLSARVPIKYANKTAVVEVKRFIKGEVRYIRLGVSRTKSNVIQQAATMTFKFKKSLKQNDLIRVKVAGTQVIKQIAGSI